ncbi:hypothetical protein LTR17_011852 [Elasticomyces elasticus]|nr:hypothetical protein LTR17_011852 [Elasticomyces elasticus]
MIENGGSGRFTPRRKVSQFMVCKEYFVAAARAYVSAQTWKLPDSQCVNGPRTFHPDGGLFHQHARRVRLYHTRNLRRVRECVNLTHLRITLDPDNFQDLRGKDIYEDVCTHIDFYGLYLTETLQIVEGVHPIKFKADEDNLWDNRREPGHKTWINNVQLFEDFFEQYVLAPRRTNIRKKVVGYNSTTINQALYPGSRVCFGTNRILPDSKALNSLEATG